MKYLVDSSAWIEYLEGSASGETVHAILQEKSNEIFVISLNIAEVVSKVKRMKKNSDLAYEVVVSHSKMLNVTPRIAREAGVLHAEMKSKNSGFSLADAMIVKAAESVSAQILTKDSHFKSFKNVVMI